MEDLPNDPAQQSVAVNQPSEVSSCNGELQNLPEEVVIILNQGPFDQEQPTQDLTVARYVAVAGENGCTFELIPESARQQPRSNTSQQDALISESHLSHEHSLGETSTKPPANVESASQQGIDEISVEFVNEDDPVRSDKLTGSHKSQKKYQKSRTTFNTPYRTKVNKSKKVSDEKLDEASEKALPFREKLKLMTQLRDEGKLHCPVEGCTEEFEKIRLYQQHTKQCSVKTSACAIEYKLCSYCGKKLSDLSVSTMEEHIKESHPEKNEAPDDVTMGDSSTTQLPQTPIKRKRGRPSKSEKKATLSECEENSEEPKVKRKRGRPPKNKKSPSAEVEPNTGNTSPNSDSFPNDDAINEILSSTTGLLASSKDLLSLSLDSSIPKKKNKIQPTDPNLHSSDSDGDIDDVDHEDLKLAYNPSVRIGPRRKPLIQRGIRLKSGLVENSPDPDSINSGAVGASRGIKRIIDNINRQYGIISSPSSHLEASKVSSTNEAQKASTLEEGTQLSGEGTQASSLGDSVKLASSNEMAKRAVTKSPATGLQRLVENIHKQQHLILSPAPSPKQSSVEDFSKGEVEKDSLSLSRDWGSARKTYITSQDIEPSPPSSQNVPVKRGRGRPRKVIEEKEKDSNTKPRHSVRFENDPKIYTLDDKSIYTALYSTSINPPNYSSLNSSSSLGNENIITDTDSSLALTIENGIINVKDIASTSVSQSDSASTEPVSNSLPRAAVNETFDSLKEPSPLFTDPPSGKEMMAEEMPSEAKENPDDFPTNIDDNLPHNPINPFPNLEEPIENDSNNQNDSVNQTPSKPENTNKQPSCKPIKRLSNSFLKKIANKVVHDIYQLPPICAKKEEISMESFIESPKYDNVVFSSLTNVRGKPIRKQPPLYLKSNVNNSTSIKPTSSNLDQEVNDEFDPDINDFSDLPPEDIEEAKKKLYYAFRWSKGKNRMRIINALQKNILDLANSKDESPPRETETPTPKFTRKRKRGRPPLKRPYSTNYRSYHPEHHSSSDEYFPSNENSFSSPSSSNVIKAHLVPRGWQRGGSRGRGGRGGHHSSSNDSHSIVISENAQIPQILEMIQPIINRMSNQTTKVLIIPSTALKSNPVLQQPHSSTIEPHLDANVLKPAVKGFQRTINDGALPSTSSVSKQGKRRGRRHLLPNSSDEEPPDGPYTCSTCQETIEDYNFARAHVWKKHYGLARLNNDIPYKENEKVARLRKALRKFNCLVCKNSFCKRVFKNEAGFYYHYISCGKEDPHVECKICGKKLMPASLSQHIKNKHLEYVSKDKSSSSESSSDEDSPEEAYPINSSSGRVRKAAYKARYVVRKFIREEKKSLNKYLLPEDAMNDSDYESDKPLSKRKSRKIHEDLNETEYLASEEGTDDELDRSYKTTLTYYPDSLSYPYRQKLNAWSGFYIIPPYLMSPEMEDQWQSDLLNQGHIKCKAEECGQTFSTIAEMQHHLLNCAEKDDGWKCLICNACFDHPRFLLFHLKSRHEDKVDHEVIVENQPLVIPFSKAMDWSLKYHLENDSLEVFPEWQPQHDSWEYLPTGWEEHLPPETISPYFRSSYESKWKTVKQFEADLPKRGSCNTTFFTGGPVWAAAWCPLPPGAYEKQYIALATDSSEIGMRHPYFADQTSNTKGLIQLWDCGYLTFRSASSTPCLSLAIVYDSGPACDLCWCPSGCWEEPQAKNDPGTLPRLGLLAAAFNNGDIAIFSIPHPNFLEYPEDKDDDTLKKAPRIWKAEPVLTLYLSGPGPSSFSNPSPCCHLSWLPTDGQKLLAAAYAKGTVALWDVASLSDAHPILKAQPILTFLAHQHAVTGIQWCPQSGSRFLATCSIDRMVKIWDLDDPGFPLMSYKSGSLIDLHWTPHWCGVAAAQDDAFTLPNHTFFRDTGYFHYGSMLTVHNAPVWSLSLSEWLNAALSCDHAGELVGLVLPSMDKCINKPISRRRFPLYRVQLEDLATEPVAQPMDESDAEEGSENQDSSVKEVVNSLVSEVEKEASSSCEDNILNSIKKSLDSSLGAVIANIKKALGSFNFDPKSEVDKAAAQKVESLLDKLLCILEPMAHCLQENSIPSLLGSLTHVTTLIKHCHKESAAIFRNYEGSALDILLELGDKILGWLQSFANDVSKASSLLKQMTDERLSAEEQRIKFLSVLTKARKDYHKLKAKFGIVYKDHNLKDLKKIHRSEYQRLTKSETMNSPDYLNFPLNSLTTVKWNPNLGSHLWLVSGGQVGLCRLTLVAGLYQPTMERTVKKAHTWFKNNSNR